MTWSKTGKEIEKLRNRVRDNQHRLGRLLVKIELFRASCEQRHGQMVDDAKDGWDAIATPLRPFPTRASFR